jgi:hypothetical protein
MFPTLNPSSFFYQLLFGKLLPFIGQVTIQQEQSSNDVHDHECIYPGIIEESGIINLV